MAFSSFKVVSVEIRQRYSFRLFWLRTYTTLTGLDFPLLITPLSADKRYLKHSLRFVLLVDIDKREFFSIVPEEH